MKAHRAGSSDDYTGVRGCKLIQSLELFTGKQGLTYREGISAETTGATALCMHTLIIPPHVRGFAHKHEAHETAIYVVAGEAYTWYGDNLENFVVVKAGSFFFIPPGVPHLPANEGDTPCFAVISRTDPNEQESVVMLPELDDAWVERSKQHG
jgi:uncharacterized RmlC-like cupin family protein